MPPLRELRYDRLTLSPRPRSFPLHRAAGTLSPRDPFHPRDLFPCTPFFRRRQRTNYFRRNARRYVGGDAATSEYDDEDDGSGEVPTVALEEGITEEYFSDHDSDHAPEDEDEDEETLRYVVGPDSIRFLPPVDDGSLVVFDRWSEVHVPSPWPWSNWTAKPEPWQRFYLDLGAGRRARSEKEMNQELWIAFLLDRGAGRHSPWWMDLERAFVSSSSAGPDLDDPHGAAKRRCLRAAEDDRQDPAAGGPSPGAAP